MLPFNYYLFRDRRRLDKKVSNACLIKYPQRTQGEEAGCENITEKSILGVKWQVQNISTLPK